MYPLVETIRYENGSLHNLELHQKRMDRSRAELFPNGKSISLTDAVVLPKKVTPDTLYKVRVLYGEKIGAIEWLPYSFTPLSSFALVEDDTLDYHLKYSDRTCLNKLSALQGEADSFIVVQKNCITDMSYGNLIFFDGTGWFTPSQPLLKGVMREKMILEGILFERNINVRDLRSFSCFKYINAMIPPERCKKLPIESIMNLP